MLIRKEGRKLKKKKNTFFKVTEKYFKNKSEVPEPEKIDSKS